mmetsp:Transcript_25164/g.34677  ORF Transcript_25164/g.34677 Transcript_25164/m.34677 type:complete len:402 (+) Transcript_25164:141-1346(+)
MQCFFDSLRAAQYQLALLLCRASRQQEAEALLASLGVKFCINPVLLTPDPSPQNKIKFARKSRRWRNKALQSDAPLQVFKNALPPDLRSHLKAGFVGDSVFWAEHKYDDPETSFFSYSCAVPVKDPQSSIEQAVGYLYSVMLADESTKEWMSRVSLGEWWVHKRPHSAAHQMHFDADERFFRSGSSYRLFHPSASSVTFLSGAGTGGATCVTDQVLEGGFGRRAWMVTPEAGTLLAYRGNVLHGVLPPPLHTKREASDVDLTELRTTLMVTWWEEKEDLAMGPQTEVGRVAQGPRSPHPQAHCNRGPQWPRLFIRKKDGWGASVAETVILPRAHSPVWIPLKLPLPYTTRSWPSLADFKIKPFSSCNSEPSQHLDNILSTFVTGYRLFLHNATEFEDVYIL